MPASPSSPSWSTASTCARCRAARRSRTCTSTRSTSAVTGPPSPSSTSPTTCAGWPSWSWAARSGQGAVERRLDVQGGAGEDRQVDVGLVDEELELGAAEQDPLGARVPQLVDQLDPPAPGVVEHVAVHQLLVDGRVEPVVLRRRWHQHLEAVAR